jgi:catechol 2,3-dioxygenase-like lactoylglutathione lyase family enzyme
MIPALPCASIDEIADFYTPLGFETTYRQVRPNPYLALRRDDLELHYFGMDGFRPEDSYGTCLVVVDDTGPLFEAFAAGLRAAYGKLPLAGLPRITRPRRRKNAGYLSGFSLIDPSGNWIRVIRAEVSGEEEPVPAGRLADALANAVVLADSHGDEAQAAKILAGAVRRVGQDADVVQRVQALAYLAELEVRNGRPDQARERLAELEAIELTAGERGTAQDALREARELATTLSG